MNFLHFEYVLAILRAGTIRRAAEGLYISPQSLSEHLSRLEGELGAPLFYRTRPLTLTEAGESFVRCAESCMEARRVMEDELSALRRREASSLVIGVPTGMTPPLMLAFLKRSGLAAAVVTACAGIALCMFIRLHDCYWYIADVFIAIDEKGFDPKFLVFAGLALGAFLIGEIAVFTRKEKAVKA